jgi:hypothetical protein
MTELVVCADLRPFKYRVACNIGNPCEVWACHDRFDKVAFEFRMPKKEVAATGY